MVKETFNIKNTRTQTHIQSNSDNDISYDNLLLTTF